MKNIILVLLLIPFGQNIKAQIISEWGVGPEVIYNVPINGLGLGIRSHVHFSPRWFISPQVTNFPGWNQVSEYYFGANLNYNFIPNKKWGIYAAMGPYYNHWSNFASSSYSEAQKANFSVEMGGGIVKNFGCLRPFLEYRANTKWWESNLRLGFNVYLKSCGGGGGERGRDGYKCPAYTSL